MSDMSVGKLYSWVMKDTGSLARGFATPDVLEANAAVIVKPGQEAIVFIDDDLKHFDQIGTHVMTGTMRVNIADAIRIARAGGSVHTSFASAITIFDVRTRLFPPETIMLPTAGGEDVYITLSGAYRIVNVPLMVRSALPMTPSPEDPGAFDLRADSDFVRDIVGQMASIADAILRQETAAAQTPAEAAKMALRPGVTDEIVRQVNAALSRTGFRMDSARLSVTERACPYCRRQLSALDIRNRRCGNAQTGCNQPLESCPTCDAIVGKGQTICHRCRSELLWCDNCKAYAQVEHSRFCKRCRGACYPFLSR